MKNILITCLLLVVGTSIAHAQLNNRFSIGPRVGVNITNHTGVQSNSTQNLVVGVTSTYSINEKTGITIDGLYSRRGYDLGSTNKLTNYLEIPVLYTSFFGSLGEPFRPKIYAGFAPSFLLSATSNNNDISTQFNTTTLDVIGGIGFNYRLANRVWLNADLRAVLGLMEVEKNSNYKNRTIQFSAGVAYGL